MTPSEYPWEREALAFVRERLPDHDPYHAWATFEFITLDGTINEVDLLVLTPAGLYLVEVKSRPGEIAGDAGTWTERGPRQVRAHVRTALDRNRELPHHYAAEVRPTVPPGDASPILRRQAQDREHAP